MFFVSWAELAQNDAADPPDWKVSLAAVTIKMCRPGIWRKEGSYLLGNACCWDTHGALRTMTLAAACASHAWLPCLRAICGIHDASC